MDRRGPRISLSGSSSAELGEGLIRRLESLRPKRRAVEPLWRRAFDYTYPIRGAGLAASGDILTSADRSADYAESKSPEIYDSTPADCARILGSALMSGLTPANSRWFDLDLSSGKNDDAAKRWLDVAAEELWELIHESNYDSVGFECMIDAAIAGQFAMFIDEDPDLGGFVFEQWALSECFFACSKAAGAVDTVFREFSLTLEQMVEEYGEEALDADNRKLWQDRHDNQANYDKPVEILWAIYPRRYSRPTSRFGVDLPFASCHVVKKSKHLLRENGFHEFPVVAPRWMLIPKSVYATGAAYEALADIATLNEVIKLDLLNLDIAITGMYVAKDDGVLNARSITIGPRKIIITGDTNNFKRLESSGNVQAALIKVESLHKSIRRVMMADQLEPQDKPNMTAYEVHVRVELVRQLLGPIYGRMQAEYLAPLVIRCFGLAYRAGALGAAPKSIGAVPRVKYISPIARAQKLVDVAAMDRYETTLAQEEKIRPGVADNYDWDEGARHRAELLGVPMRLIPDKDDIARVRADRAKQQQQAAAAEALQGAGGVNSFGPGLDAPIAPGVGLGGNAELLAA